MPGSPAQDEWRVEVNLDDPEHGYPLAERLRAHDLDDEVRERLGDRVLVTRDGPRLFLYALDERAVRESERVIRELIEADDLTATVAVTRWHPDQEVWRDAAEPLPRTEAERRAERERRLKAETREAAATGELDWEVRVGLEHRSDTVALAERLGAEGLPVVRRWRYLVVGALTEEGARELAERILAEVPEGATAEVRARFDEPTDPLFVFLESR